MYERTYIQLSSIVKALEKEVYFKDGVILISDTKPLPSDSYIEFLKQNLNDNTVQSNNDLFKTTSKSVVSINVEETGTATGFYINKNLILTNYHFVSWKNKMTATTSDKNTYDIEGIYWFDELNDLAIIKIADGESKTWLNIDNTSVPKIGDKVLTIGNPENLNWSLSEGVISAFRNNIYWDTKSIQTDVAVTFGSSGSPLFNENGDVIGIISSGVEGTDINFAADVTMINDVVNKDLYLIVEADTISKYLLNIPTISYKYIFYVFSSKD